MTFQFWLGLFLGAGIACIPFWIKVRGLAGVIRDSKDAARAAGNVANKIKGE